MAPPTSQRRCNEVSNLFSGSKLDLTNCMQAAILAHEAGLLEGDT
jgi:hypothetical protein